MLFQDILVRAAPLKDVVEHAIDAVAKELNAAHAKTNDAAMEFLRSKDAFEKLGTMLEEMYLERMPAGDASAFDLQLGDIALGLKILAERERRAVLQNEPKASSKAVAERFAAFVPLCASLYDVESDDVFLEKLKLLCGDENKFQLLECDFKSQPGMPAYAIVANHSTKEIVLILRGTQEIHDILTDVKLRVKPFEGGLAHAGISEAAINITEKAAPTILKAKDELDDYDVTITGHSLGAGCAVLTALLLRRHYSVWATSVGFACPAIIDDTLMAEFEHQSWYVNVSNEYDVVSRFTEGAAEDLLNQIISVAQEEKESRYAEARRQVQDMVGEVASEMRAFQDTVDQDASDNVPDYIPEFVAKGANTLRKGAAEKVRERGDVLVSNLNAAVDDALELLKSKIVTPQPAPFGLMGPTATRLHSPTQYMYYSIPRSKGDSANGDGESESVVASGAFLPRSLTASESTQLS